MSEKGQGSEEQGQGQGQATSGDKPKPADQAAASPASPPAAEPPKATDQPIDEGNKADAGGDGGGGSVAGATEQPELGDTVSKGGGNAPEEEFHLDDEPERTPEPPKPPRKLKFPDGTRMERTEDGEVSITDKSGRTGVLQRDQFGSGGEWVDPETGQPMPGSWKRDLPAYEGALDWSSREWADQARRYEENARNATETGDTENAEYQRELARTYRAMSTKEGIAIDGAPEDVPPITRVDNPASLGDGILGRTPEGEIFYEDERYISGKFDSANDRWVDPWTGHPMPPDFGSELPGDWQRNYEQFRQDNARPSGSS